MGKSNSLRMEHKFKAMGGEFRLLCFPQSYHSREDVTALFTKAQEEVLRIEEKMTDFKESPFNKINQYAGITPVAVDKELWNIINKSLDISKKSNGLFDISYASIGHPWREKKDTGKKMPSLEREKLKRFINYKKIKLNKKKQTVFLPHKKMKIGLGGIGKGYAVDRVFNLLKNEGIYNFYVNGSGDIRVHSHANAPRPWKIGIRNPFSKDSTKSVGIIQLRRGSIASSGGYIQKIDNKKFTDHHILNPHKGFSEDHLISATVIDDDMVSADTTATILINLSSSQAIAYLDKSNLTGVVIDSSGKTHLSKKALKGFGLER